MRNTLFLLPLLAAAALVAAQDADDASAASPAELVKQLGHEDFAVREKATAALVKMGEKAVPALEKALESDDLEVRLRAGRALRKIRGAERDDRGQDEAAGDEADPEPRGKGRPFGSPGASMVQIQMHPDGVSVTVTRMVDGKQETKAYKGKSLEALKKKHPELRDVLGNRRFGFPFGRDPGDPFDMDRFWKEWRKRDDPFRKWHEETRRELEEMRRTWEQLRRSREKQLREFESRRDRAAGHRLGVRVQRPEPVVDAQLQLRGRGLVVHAVEKGTTADDLGLRKHDILVELNGVEIRRFEDVARALARAPGAATAKVVREAELVELFAATRPK